MRETSIFTNPLMKRQFSLVCALLFFGSLAVPIVYAQIYEPPGDKFFRLEDHDYGRSYFFETMDGLGSESEIIENHVVDADGGETTEKIPGQIHYGNIVLTFRYTESTANALWQWRRQVIEGDSDAARDVGILVMNEAGEEIVEYDLINAWPSKWSLEVDTATSAAIIIVEIAVEKVERT